MSVATQSTTQQIDHLLIASQMRDIVKYLGDMFFERGEELEVLAATMLAKQHAFILGPPGTGKSNLVEELCHSIVDAEFWSILMDRQLGKEESFGAINIGKYEQTGVWERDVSNTLVTAHIAFVDEVGKAGPASLNPMLRAFNERKFRNGQHEIDLPLISVIGASNEYLEAELAAMWDRFLVRLRVDYLQEPSKFAALLDSAVAKPATQQIAVVRPTIDLEDFLAAVNYGVPAVKLPPGVQDTIVTLRSELRNEQITPSDRRFKQSVRLLQAVAYLNGRDVVDEDDLAILQHVLWDNEQQIPTVRTKVLSLTSPITKQALEFEQMLTEIDTAINDLKGQSREAKSAYGGDAQHKVTEIRHSLDKLIEQANREGRSTAKLDRVKGLTKALRVRVYIECLMVPKDRAERLGEKED